MDNVLTGVNKMELEFLMTFFHENIIKYVRNSGIHSSISLFMNKLEYIE